MTPSCFAPSFEPPFLLTGVQSNRRSTLAIKHLFNDLRLTGAPIRRKPCKAYRQGILGSDARTATCDSSRCPEKTRTIGEATRWRACVTGYDRRRAYLAAERAEIVVAAGAEVTTVALHACVGAKAPHGAAHDRRIDAIVEADVLEIRRILVQRDRTTTELAALEDLTARGTIATRARRKRP